MLIEKKTIDKDDVVSIKIITGEELLTKVIALDATGYSVSKPFSLVLSQNGIAMIPFLLCADDSNLRIDNSKIIFIAKADKEASKQYLQKVTGLTIARPGDISGLVG